MVADHDAVLLAEVAAARPGRCVDAPAVDLYDQVGLRPVEVEPVLAVLAVHDLDLAAGQPAGVEQRRARRSS